MSAPLRLMPTNKKSKPKSRAPMVATVAIVVADRTAAKDWYTSKLGMNVLADDDHWVVVGRKGEGGQLHLCQRSEAGEGIEMEPGTSGILLLLAGDFRKACAGLKESGVEFTQGPEKAPWGWCATVRDPDGNEHFLMPAA
ncbi:MAG: VOC family protein [Thermoplasmata archaeon]|nr:VOC family protein [Thermoplasmata archaeon]